MRAHTVRTIGPADIQGVGWSAAEPEGRWSIAPTATVHIEAPDAPHWFIELHGEPRLRGAATRNFSVTIDGCPAGEAVFHRRHIMAFACPPAVPGKPVTVRFDFHNPDDRGLSIFLRKLRIIATDAPAAATCRQSCSAAPAAALDEFLMQFEPLVGNCTFGFIQRACGAEPIGLTRFASAFPYYVTLGIQAGFDGLGEDIEIMPGEPPFISEWLVKERTYNLLYHTFTEMASIEASDIQRREKRGLAFRRRMLMENISHARKIFVCRDEWGLQVEEVMALHLALRSYAPCTLLWARPDSRFPLVEEIAPGLLCGSVMPWRSGHDPRKANIAAWLAVCANAWMLSSHLVGDPARVDQAKIAERVA